MRNVIAIAACLITAPAAAQMFRDIPDHVANVYPTNARAEILAYLRATLRDRSSVRDAAITEPFLAFRGAGNRYIACIRFNGKNGFGGWTGPQAYVASFFQGRLSGIAAPHFPQDCQGARWQPFPELARLR